MERVNFSRRSFLKTLGAAAIAAPFFTHNLVSAAPSDRVRYAAFGTANMARADINSIISHPKIDFVAACDVDANYLADIKKLHPELRVYKDYRTLLEKEAKNLDCVSVTVPDHGHAIMAMSAMQLGLDVYCQKPLAHDLYEVRKLTEFAKSHKRITQMGIQIHSNDVYRTTVNMIQSGLIGKIKETYSWCCNRGWGKLNTEKRPNRTDAVPESLDWDLWLNTAEERPYLNEEYHPNNWRKVQAFGTGIFGDMGCHIFDPVFKALKLTAPLTVRSEGPKPSEDYWELSTTMHYTFPGTEYTEGEIINVHWYDGQNHFPPEEIMKIVPNMPVLGSIFFGTKGILVIPHIGAPRVYMKEGDKYVEFEDDDKLKELSLPSLNHWHQFVDAVRGEGDATANFSYAGPLTESVLLGSVACKFPMTTLKWNAKKLKFDLKEANSLIKRSYRKGWSVKGL